jgi:hypothetical protein
MKPLDGLQQLGQFVEPLLPLVKLLIPSRFRGRGEMCQRRQGSSGQRPPRAAAKSAVEPAGRHVWWQSDLHQRLPDVA